jgi:hypothetical protein
MNFRDERPVRVPEPSGRDLRATDASPSAAPSVGRLSRDFLAWVACGNRSYAEAMEAWRTSCPRFTIWEDAIGDGLIRVENGGTTPNDATVSLTPRGRALLEST